MNSYNIRNDEIEAVLRKLANQLKEQMPEGWGFTLQIFSYGENGVNFYISTANRDDMIRLMQEFINREKH